MDILKSFRHHRTMYEISGKFDRPLNIVLLRVLLSFLFILKHTKLYVLISKIHKTPLPNLQNDKRVSFVYSKNQMTIIESLRALEIHFPVIFMGDFVKERPEGDHLLSDRALLLEALKANNLYDILLKAKNDPQLKNNLIRVVKLAGCHRFASKVLKLNQIDLVINLNDHNAYSVLIYDLAQKHKIKTVYIQHAPVSLRFPPLYHDINILFSQDSYDKYRRQEEVRSFIMFDPRFALRKSENDSEPSSNSVLICPNRLDEIEKVAELVEKLHHSYKVYVRPHPSDHRPWDNIKNCKITSNSAIWEDISLVNIVVTNESAVVLEALFFDRLIYKASFFSETLDNYGFLEKGLLLTEHSEIESLMESIDSRKKEYNKAMLSYFIGHIDNPKERAHQIFNQL